MKLTLLLSGQSGRKALNILDIRWASLTSRFPEPGMNKRETHLHISLADCLLSNCARFQWNGHFDPLDPRDVVDGHDGCRLVASCSSRFRRLTHDKCILDSFQCVLGSLRQKLEKKRQDIVSRWGHDKFLTKVQNQQLETCSTRMQIELVRSQNDGRYVSIW